MPLQVIIVGAGIGGLVAAISLRRSGHKVTVLEKRHDKSEVGYALEIPPNASRILKTLGLDLSKVRGCRQTGIDIFDAERPIMALKMSEERPNEDDAPCISVHRQDYYQALKDLAVGKDGVGCPAELKLGRKVTSYDVENASVMLDRGETLKADLIVAADGNSSLAHKWIIGEERLPQLTGMSNVRFTLTTDQVLQCAGEDPFVKRGLDGRACIYSDSEANAIMHYPCRDGTLQNFGVYQCTQPDSRPIQNNIKAVAKERVRKMNSSIQSLVDLVEEKNIYLWQIVDRDPLPRIHKSNLLLIGDANHPMRPTMGQGASQAVEDAAILGLLMQHVESEADVLARVRIWADLRRPRAGAIQLMSRTSPTAEGWPNPEDKRKAEQFFPHGGLPQTRAEMTAYAHRHDVLAEAREALAAL